MFIIIFFLYKKNIFYIILLYLIIIILQFIKIILNIYCKNTIKNSIFYRPCINNKIFAYPSTHITITTLFLCIINNGIINYNYIYLFLMSLSRYFLNKHNIFQIIGGYIYGNIIYNIILIMEINIIKV